MSVSYNRLFKLLIDKKMKKGELCEKADITYQTLHKMSKGENVTADVIVKICTALGVDPNDIMEIIPNEENK